MENVSINGHTRYIANSVCVAKASGTLHYLDGRPLSGLVVIGKGECLELNGSGSLAVYSSSDEGQVNESGAELLALQIFLTDLQHRIDTLAHSNLTPSQSSVELTILSVEIDSYLDK